MKTPIVPPVELNAQAAQLLEELAADLNAVQQAVKTPAVVALPMAALTTLAVGDRILVGKRIRYIIELDVVTDASGLSTTTRHKRGSSPTSNPANHSWHAHSEISCLIEPHITNGRLTICAVGEPTSTVSNQSVSSES